MSSNDTRIDIEDRHWADYRVKDKNLSLKDANSSLNSSSSSLVVQMNDIVKERDGLRRLFSDVTRVITHFIAKKCMKNNAAVGHASHLRIVIDITKQAFA